MNSIVYTILSRSSNLHVPQSLTITQNEIESDENLVPFVVKFSCEKLGNHSTLIELKSLPDDIRVIPIDFRVTESAISDSTTAYLEFNSCVFDTVTQPIPIKNNSEISCNYEVEIDSKPNESLIFRGMSKFVVKPKDVFVYELSFLPTSEQKFEALLKLNNITEGIQYKYFLTGIGERRPPLGDLKLDTKVGQVTHHEIIIPNKSNKKICFYVSSNSNFIRGPEKIMLLPNKKESYKFDIVPTQRGSYKGAITFRPGEWPIKDIDSDGEEMSKAFNEETHQQFTLWFSFDLKVQPQAAQSIIELEAHTLDTSTLCVPLTNPFSSPLDLRVIKQGNYLEGADKITIKSQEKYNYELLFKPKQVGKFRGNLIFVNDDIGEFWFDLKLLAVDPMPIQAGVLQCEVGRYTIHTLKFTNPVQEPIQFRVLISNSSNFALERKQNELLDVEASGTIDLNIIFTPSTLGFADHFCLISFFNEKVGNITYELRGVGLEPDTQDPIHITAECNQAQLVTINFRNSTDSAIYCDLLIVDEHTSEPLLTSNSMQSLGTNNTNENQVFNILLDKLQSLHVGPRGVLDIPVVFTPNELRRYEVKLIVSARREARMSWVEQDPKQNVERLQWVYPIKGFSVVNAIKKSTPFVLECMARKRLEKRMEVILSGVTTYASGLDRAAMRLRSITPKQSMLTTNSSQLTKSTTALTVTATSRSDEFASTIPTTTYPDNNTLTQVTDSNSLVILGDANQFSSEYVYTIHFSGNLDQVELAKNSIALKLIRTQRDKSTGLVMLTFDFIFCPSKSFIIDANLSVETALGGLWLYPIKLVAIESPADDVITIEAIRLNRESLVGFRLSSKTDQPLPFKAQFYPQTDVFSITPSIGELLPESDDGTLIKIGFTPTTYGKVFQSQLIISTPTYQWKYVVKGVTPEYVVPRGQSGIPPAPRSDPRMKRFGKKRNYIVENTYIIQTAVSSPIKGAALVPMRYANQT